MSQELNLLTLAEEFRKELQNETAVELKIKGPRYVKNADIIKIREKFLPQIELPRATADLNFLEKVDGFLCNLTIDLKRIISTNIPAILLATVDAITDFLNDILSSEKDRTAAEKYFNTSDTLRDFIKTTSVIVVNNMRLSIKFKITDKIQVTIPEWLSKFVIKTLIKKAVDAIFNKYERRIVEKALEEPELQ